PLLEGDDAPVGADRAQQRERERTRARARLDDAAAGIDVGPEEDHREVLRVDHLRAARHVEHVLRERRPEGHVPEAHRGAHPRPLGLADDRGMSALTASAAGKPQWSATEPSAATPRPPAPMAKPTMSPEAIPALRGR